VTTFLERTETCAVCGSPAQVQVLASTNTLGPPDLDTRPAPMARHTMPLWLRECGACGFLARDLTRPHPGTAEVLRSQEYRAQRRDARFPDLANRFLCAAMILERAEGWAGAFWNVMAAAWACDDAERDDLARECRARAIGLHGRAPVSRQTGVDELVLADLRRRTGDFAGAIEAVEAGLARGPEPAVREALERERGFAGARDASAR
jgi:hypothetical protein